MGVLADGVCAATPFTSGGNSVFESRSGSGGALGAARWGRGEQRRRQHQTSSHSRRGEINASRACRTINNTRPWKSADARQQWALIRLSLCKLYWFARAVETRKQWGETGRCEYIGSPRGALQGVGCESKPTYLACRAGEAIRAGSGKSLVADATRRRRHRSTPTALAFGPCVCKESLTRHVREARASLAAKPDPWAKQARTH